MAHQGKRMISEDLLAAIKAIKDSGVTAADLIAVAEALKDGDLQGKLTAGDNITITDENVISATDTTYTAGDNITIEDGVISATAASKEYHVSSFEIYQSGANTDYRAYAHILDNTKISTKELLTKWLYDKGYRSNRTIYSCTGKDDVSGFWGLGLFSTNGTTNLSMVVSDGSNIVTRDISSAYFLNYHNYDE